MLNEKDKIFKNLYGLKGKGLTVAKSLGDWKNTKGFIEKGKQWILDEVKKSGLRGRGGAGFPTALKWSFMPPSSENRPNYFVVNADESEPGTCKDREIIRNEPYKLLEGILYACIAMEAKTSYIYIRGEFYNEYKALEEAIKQCYEQNLLGENILNTGFNLDVFIHRGAGAYICGEESSMLESLEGKRGLPRHKPPFPSQVGLFGRPTLIHNVETVFWVREILEKGAVWFSSHGLNGRKGLRTYSVSGRVKNPGVKLAPAGITIKQLIDEYCGGIQEGHTFKAYLPGGASGGILPAKLDNVPLDLSLIHI